MDGSVSVYGLYMRERDCPGKGVFCEAVLGLFISKVVFQKLYVSMDSDGDS